MRALYTEYIVRREGRSPLEPFSSLGESQPTVPSPSRRDSIFGPITVVNPGWQ